MTVSTARTVVVILTDDCAICGARAQYLTEDGDAAHWKHVLSADDSHTPEPTSPTYRYILARYNESKATA